MITELMCLQNQPQGPTLQDAIITTEVKNPILQPKSQK